VFAIEIEFVRQLHEPRGLGVPRVDAVANPGGVAPLPQCFSKSVRAASSYGTPAWCREMPSWRHRMTASMSPRGSCPNARTPAATALHSGEPDEATWRAASVDGGVTP